MDRIEFRLEGTWGYMSNFYPYQIIDDTGVVWASTEHYYQAMKTLNMTERAVVWAAATAAEAKKLGKPDSGKVTLRKNWALLKIVFMEKALEMKFPGDDQLSELLMSTAPAELCEWAPWDKFWGLGPDGKGENHLGRLLMERRTRLLQAEAGIYI